MSAERRLRGVLLLSLIGMFPGCATIDNPPAPKGRFVWLRPESLTGRVGHHFAGVVVGTDCPTDSRADFEFETPLPPGLQQNYGTNYRVTGTPQQPGSWPVRVSMRNYWCGSQTVPDRVFEGVIRIEGDAPRRVPR